MVSGVSCTGWFIDSVVTLIAISGGSYLGSESSGIVDTWGGWSGYLGVFRMWMKMPW